MNAYEMTQRILWIADGVRYGFLDAGKAAAMTFDLVLEAGKEGETR